MRKLAIGDIHGNYKALMHTLELCNYDPNNDMLITLGDYTDGYPETDKVLDVLCGIDNIIPLLGNHCLWLKEYLMYGVPDNLWLRQGGQIVYDHYIQNNEQKSKHLEFLNSCYYYYIDEDNNVFVHGGYYDLAPIDKQDKNELIWDRELTDIALYRNIECIFQEESFTPKNVFIGHTCTHQWGTDKPIQRNNLINLDTGAGYAGKLTIMDIDTKEYWQSDNANNYYPGFKHR